MIAMGLQEHHAARFIRAQLIGASQASSSNQASGVSQASIAHRRIVVLGLDDGQKRQAWQRAPGQEICRCLLQEGARLVLLDRPRNRIAMGGLLASEAAPQGLPGRFELESDIASAFRLADAALLLPGWKQDHAMTWRALAASMHDPGWVFDTRSDGDLSRPAACGLETWQLSLGEQGLGIDPGA
jgi:hypothetical protein